jgi:hypothetical protein
MFDAFNLANSAAVTNFNLTNGASYNQIIAALDPRTLAVRYPVRFLDGRLLGLPAVSRQT